MPPHRTLAWYVSGNHALEEVMRAHKRKAAVYLAILAPSHVSLLFAAYGATVDFTGWKPTNDPFHAEAASNSITSVAPLDLQAGVRASIKASCVKGQVQFT